MTACTICGATGDAPCVTASGRPARSSHVGREAVGTPLDTSTGASNGAPEPATSAVWLLLSDVQADAVRATAAKHLRDPDGLALEMAPLLAERPTPVAVEPEPEVDDGGPETPAVIFLDNVVAEPVWTLLGTTESGSGLYVRPVRPHEIPVNDPLTAVTLTGVSL